MFKLREHYVLLILFLCFANPLLAFDAAATFEKKCVSCHTIGGGDDVGPDLKGISKRRDPSWTIRFIKESQAVIAEGDPVGVELFQKFRNKKMPDQEFSDDEIKQLIDFIESGAQTQTAKVKSALDATPQEIQRGRELFEGRIRFKNGGPNCLSCHSAGTAGILGGGGLGPDLSHTYASYGDAGISKVITNISFPTMIVPYKDKKLEAEEVYQLKAFLHQVDKEEHEALNSMNLKKFIFLGIIGSVLGLGAMDLAWRKRRKKTRRPL